jgi:uncharacterized protein YbjT (DUF2867 family)
LESSKIMVATTTTTTKSINSKVKTFLVTGATSMVGKELVKGLSTNSKNIRIKAAGRSEENIKRIINSDKVESIRFDYARPETLREAVRDVDSIFLITPFQSDMVELTSNLLREIKNAGNIKQIVKLSVLRGDDADKGIISDKLHLQTEKMIEDSGIAYTFLCPTIFMQNFTDSYLLLPKRGEVGTFYLPAGDGKVSFVDVRDIVKIAVQVLTNNDSGIHNGNAYNITGPEALSFGDAARILSEQVGKNISYINISEDDARRRMKDIGYDEWRINFLIELYNLIRLGYLSDVISPVEELTGKKAITFNQFAKDYADAI